MSFLVLAWKMNEPGLIHDQHLSSLIAVERLLTALVQQTDANFITIRIIPDVTNLQMPLPAPSSSPTGHKSAPTPKKDD